LLGTVTGMINTFKLITIFGTGDASTFSSGISEALLTTMWGLVTAIPALLMAAFLSRKARTTLDDMEKLAVRMMNHRNHQETVRNRGADQTDVDSDEMGGGKTVTEKPISEVKTKPIPEVQVGGEDEGLSPGLAPNPV
jgi:hypothetical protein